jgi:hypothetical protein
MGQSCWVESWGTEGKGGPSSERQTASVAVRLRLAKSHCYPSEARVVTILQFFKANPGTIRAAELDRDFDQIPEDYLCLLTEYLGEPPRSDGLAPGITSTCLTSHELRILEQIVELHPGFMVFSGIEHSGRCSGQISPSLFRWPSHSTRNCELRMA